MSGAIDHLRNAIIPVVIEVHEKVVALDEMLNQGSDLTALRAQYDQYLVKLAKTWEGYPLPEDYRSTEFNPSGAELREQGPDSALWKHCALSSAMVLEVAAKILAFTRVMMSDFTDQKKIVESASLVNLSKQLLRTLTLPSLPLSRTNSMAPQDSIVMRNLISASTQKVAELRTALFALEKHIYSTPEDAVAAGTLVRNFVQLVDYLSSPERTEPVQQPPRPVTAKPGSESYAELFSIVTKAIDLVCWKMDLIAASIAGSPSLDVAYDMATQLQTLGRLPTETPRMRLGTRPARGGSTPLKTTLSDSAVAPPPLPESQLLKKSTSLISDQITHILSNTDNLSDLSSMVSSSASEQLPQPLQEADEFLERLLRGKWYDGESAPLPTRLDALLLQQNISQREIRRRNQIKQGQSTDESQGPSASKSLDTPVKPGTRGKKATEDAEAKDEGGWFGFGGGKARVKTEKPTTLAATKVGSDGPLASRYPTISLPNGQSTKVDVSVTTSVGESIKYLCQKFDGGLSNSFAYGLAQMEEGEYCFLPNHTNLAELVADSIKKKHPLSLHFLRKVFAIMHWLSSKEDTLFAFHQLKAQVIAGHIPLSVETAVKLGALLVLFSVQGDEATRESFVRANHPDSFLPPQVLQNMLSDPIQSLLRQAKEIEASPTFTTGSVPLQYLTLVNQSSPLCGSHFYLVKPKKKIEALEGLGPVEFAVSPMLGLVVVPVNWNPTNFDTPPSDTDPAAQFPLHLPFGPRAWVTNDMRTIINYLSQQLQISYLFDAKTVSSAKSIKDLFDDLSDSRSEAAAVNLRGASRRAVTTMANSLSTDQSQPRGSVRSKRAATLVAPEPVKLPPNLGKIERGMEERTDLVLGLCGVCENYLFRVWGPRPFCENGHLDDAAAEQLEEYDECLIARAQAANGELPYFRALYRHQAVHPREQLSFKKHDLLVVIETSTACEGWGRAAHLASGDVGYFPLNYLDWDAGYHQEFPPCPVDGLDDSLFTAPGLKPFSWTNETWWNGDLATALSTTSPPAETAAEEGADAEATADGDGADVDPNAAATTEDTPADSEAPVDPVIVAD